MLQLEQLTNLGGYADKVPCVIIENETTAKFEYVKVEDFSEYELIENYEKGFPKVKKINKSLPKDRLDFQWTEVTEETLAELGVPKDLEFKGSESVTFFDFDANTFYEVKPFKDSSTKLKFLMKIVTAKEKFQKIVRSN